MVYRDKAEIYAKKRVEDGYGGHKEEEIFIKNIDCKISSMTTQKQNLYFGNISMTALSLITNCRVEYGEIIKINNRAYEVIRISKVFNKYIVDVEVLSV